MEGVIRAIRLILDFSTLRNIRFNYKGYYYALMTSKGKATLLLLNSSTIKLLIGGREWLKILLIR